MISVILNCWDVTTVQRHMTMQCIACIRKYTDPKYELIIVDNEPDDSKRFYHEYDIYKPYKYIAIYPKLNVYQAYNLGAKNARGDVLMFIQNDVFVHERTINKLAKYLKRYDMAFPQQAPITRQDVKKMYKTKDGEETHKGWRDAGLVAITRDAFEKTGGWDERYHNMLGDKAFYYRCNKAGIQWTDHTNAFITHIMAANNLSKPQELYNKEMAHDSSLVDG